MPAVPIAVCSDRRPSAPCFDLVHVLDRPHRGYGDKVQAIGMTPFARTVFLDTDTYACADFSEVFALLDRFDLAAAHASNRASTRSTYLAEGVPAAFPEMNTGVLVYRRTRRVLACFAEWRRLFARDLRAFAQLRRRRPASIAALRLKAPGDQSSFREALYRSDLRVATLPPEYNFRFKYGAFAGKAVKLLHGRHHDVASIAHAVNAACTRRVFVPGTGVLTAGRPTGWGERVPERQIVRAGR